MLYAWQHSGYIVNRAVRAPPTGYTDCVNQSPYNSNNPYFIYAARNIEQVGWKKKDYNHNENCRMLKF